MWHWMLTMTLAGGGVETPSMTLDTIDAGLLVIHETAHLPLEEAHMMPPGAGVGDFDRDGDLDLFVQGGVGQNAQLFINDGAGHFTDQADAWNIDLTADEGSSVTIGDINNDGLLDVYAGTIEGQNQLLLNVGGSMFVNIGPASGAVVVDEASISSWGATFGDVELDGDLDLLSASWHPEWPNGRRLFLNGGNGFFNEQTKGSGLYVAPFTMYSFSPALVDLNGDRYPDAPIAGDFLTSLYHANNGDGTFAYLVGNGTGSDENGMGSTFGDYDNDGDLDWFVTSIRDFGKPEGNWGTTGNRLYRNDGNHQFTDVTSVADVRDGYWGWGASFGDLNHDGWLDLVMTNGFLLPAGYNPDQTFEHDPTRLWLNTGEASFIEASLEAGVFHTADGKGLVLFDADNDGDLDLFITATHSAHAFYRNETNPSPDRWIEVDLVSPPGNAPDGIGAALTFSIGGATYTRQVFGAPSFMSQDPLRVHVGFPSATSIDEIAVTWPDGTVSVFQNVAPGQILKVVPADVTFDGVVDINDLLLVLGSWGPCDGCPADIDRNAVVDVLDLLIVLSGWG